jgi:hypothetical protein
MNISYGGLSNNRENLDGISIGAFEMAQFCAGYHPDKNRAITVLELPFMDVRNLDEEVAVSHAIYSHPAVAEEMAQWNARMLMTSPMPQYNLVGTGEPRDRGRDGRHARARHRRSGGALLRRGRRSDLRDLVRGLPGDGRRHRRHRGLRPARAPVVPHDRHRDWWTENLNPGTVNCPVVVNIDAYEALSDEHRAALDAAVEGAIDHYLANYGELLQRWDAVLEERGVERVVIDDSELALLAEQAAPIHAAWIEEMTAAGLPAQELYDLVGATLEEARASN